MQLNFNAQGHEPVSVENLPAGWYPVVMVEGKETPSKSNANNTYYAAILEVISGPGKGRKLFVNFNFNNENEQAKKIAYDQLATICHAVGVLQVPVMDVLFNKPFEAKVSVRPAVMEEDGVTEKYEARNEVKGFRKIEGGSPAAGGGNQGGNSLPAGFATEPAKAAASNPAQASSPAASAPSTPVASAPAAEAPVILKRLKMTAKANNMTAQQFREHDANWTDALLVQEGYAEWEEYQEAPKTPAAPAAPAATATAPATSTPVQTSAPAAAGESDDETPPWLVSQ